MSRQERRFLTWCCDVMPERITSDHLTVFGVLGAVLVLVGYMASRAAPQYLWLAAAGYVIHWFGDSLDGALARHRAMTRPRYGYFLDHSLDAFCILLMVGGMGLTAFVRMDVALFVVVGYFLLAIHVFLKNHVSDTFQRSFLRLGPTELRIVFVAITLWMFVQGGSSYHLGWTGLSGYDLAMLATGLVFVGLFSVNTLAMILRLRRIEGDGRNPLAAAAAAAGRPATAPATGARSTVY